MHIAIYERDSGFVIDKLWQGEFDYIDTEGASALSSARWRRAISDGKERCQALAIKLF
jgi:hypothetical protein